MNIAIINDIGKITVFLLVLLSGFLITAKSKRKLPNYLFAAFLLVTSIDLTGLFMPLAENNYIRGFKVASVLLQMPLYFLYVRAVCYYNFKLHKKHILHTVLFFGFLLLFIIENEIEAYFETFQTISKLQYHGYIIGIFYTLYNFKKVYQENYSNNYNLIYKWLLQTTILFLIGNSFVTIRELISENSPFLINLNFFISLFALGVISWFVLKALYQPVLFVGIDMEINPTRPAPSTSQNEPEELQQLLVYMQTEKPYLDDQLTLRKLALGVDFSEKELSQLINQHTGKHFFDYVNAFRIQEAQKLLVESSKLTVLEILYQVGFNSKSSFYTAFKKETGQTPTEFRKSNI